MDARKKCDFCVSVFKTNFTDHHTPDTIHSFRDSVLVCKMHECYCTICKNFKHFHPCHQAMQAIAIIGLGSKLYEKKPLQSTFKCI